jgi:hypothetical protein
MNFDCHLFYLKNEAMSQIRAAIAMDAGQPVLLTRFFHNKPVYYLVNLVRCYFGNFNLLYIIGLYGIYKLLQKRRKV